MGRWAVENEAKRESTYHLNALLHARGGGGEQCSRYTYVYDIQGANDPSLGFGKKKILFRELFIIRRTIKEVNDLHTNGRSKDFHGLTLFPRNVGM